MTRVITNLVLCTKCGKLVYGRCAKMKVSSTLAKGFLCEGCAVAVNGFVETEELPFYDQMELMKSFCYLRDRLNVRGESGAVVTDRTRNGWI